MPSTCPICLSGGPFMKIRRSRCFFSQEELVRYECPDCGVVFGTERMLALNAEELAEEYRQLHARHPARYDATDDELAVLAQFPPQIGHSYLNWGSGAISRACSEARTQGVRLTGYDPFLAQTRPLIRAQLPARAQFDGIMSNNVLEHFQDPVAALVEMLGYLAPGGTMLHRTPCYEYEYAHSKYHCFFFLGRSVEVMSERAGLVPERLGKWLVRYRQCDKSGHQKGATGE